MTDDRTAAGGPAAPGVDHSLTAAYAVDALDDVERRAAERHLAGCPSCAADLAEMARGLEALADLTAVAPDPASRAAVLAGLDGVAQLPPRQVRRAPAAGPATGAEPSPALLGGAATGGTDELAARRARRSQRVIAALSAAAAVLLVAVVGLGLSQQQLRSDRDQLRASESTIADVVSAPDARTVSVGQEQGWSGARVVVSRTQDEAVILPAGSHATPAGRAWQAWFVSADGSSVRSAGVLAKGVAVQQLHGDVRSATRIAVTLEPSGGSAKPTTQASAVFDLTA